MIKTKVFGKRNSSKWLSKGIRSCCVKKRKLFLKSRVDKDYKMDYFIYTRTLKKIITSVQKTENSKRIHNAKNKCKSVWDVIKKYTTADCNKNTIDNLRINDTNVTEPQSIAEAFNDFFVNSVNKNCSENVGTTNDIGIDNLESSIFLTPVDVQELLKIICSLKNSKAVGHDGICTEIIKKCMHYIVHPLLYAINLSLDQGIFPEVLKKSIVKPLYKKGDPCKLDNYRPVTLIPIFSKIFEKVMFIRLNNFLEKNKIITENQNGFRKRRSTSLATFKLITRIMECVDKRIPVTVIFMDMTKAFDFVCHKRLLKKLYNYGVRGPANSWISSYLNNRTQRVDTTKYCPNTKTVQNYQSSFLENSYGVPQGGILAPLLFLAYINDLPSNISHECILFADDTTLIIEGNDTSTYNTELNKALDQTITWLTANNLKVNINKTKFMQFCNSKATKENISIEHTGEKLEEVTETKFLGLMLDSHCEWKCHVDSVCTKINKFVYALRRVSQTVSLQAAKEAYHGYVDSTLRYGIVLWGNCTEMDTAFKIQKRCIRAMFGLRQTDSCRPYFKENDILPLPCVYILEVCIFVFNHKYLFQNQQDVSKRTLRSRYQNKLYKPFVNLTLTSKNCFIMCINIFNKLPDTFKVEGLNTFKKLTKKYLLSNGFYSIKEYLEHKD